MCNLIGWFALVHKYVIVKILASAVAVAVIAQDNGNGRNEIKNYFSDKKKAAIKLLFIYYDALFLFVYFEC